MMPGELPVRIIQGPRGLLMRCLCGAESATLRKGTANSTMTRLRSSGPAVPQLGADLTPAGLLIMAAHAAQCQRASEVAARSQIVPASGAGVTERENEVERTHSV